MQATDSVDFFDAEYMQKRYQSTSHKFLFPTMQDLKKEVERYVEEEMNYEGEVAGNIKTAIKARLENLCSGSKGFMFNTFEFADMNSIMKQNSVFELEGLADDNDKAFCVGLLIIFINEYRQIAKETGSVDGELAHLLVIEEAHRLLKNISAEKVSEESANPKGKAVEHFTNMIAEMRSYGQGVIVAEQIPSKLAPDVIKNSSNKIIQRLVAGDDQKLVANTIGLSPEESVDLGSLVRGTALCHKEGMQLPVHVAIFSVNDGNVSDEALYEKDTAERFKKINLSSAKECLTDVIDDFALKMLNTILIQDYSDCEKAITQYRKKCSSILLQNDTELIMCENNSEIFAEIICEAMVQYLMHGVYSFKQIVSDDLNSALFEFVKTPTQEKLHYLRKLLHDVYNDTPEYKGKYIVNRLVENHLLEDIDVCGTIKNYFWNISDDEIIEIKNISSKG